MIFRFASWALGVFVHVAIVALLAFFIVILWTLLSTPRSTPQPVGGSSAGSLLPGELAGAWSGESNIPAVQPRWVPTGAPNTRGIVPAYDPRHPVREVRLSVKERAVRPAARLVPKAQVRRAAGPIHSRAILASWKVGVASGKASHMGAGFGPSYLALPIGPGYVVRVCGAGGCVTRRSTDAGPSLAMQRQGRVADLNVWDFARVCGVPPSVGLCNVSISVLGR